MEKFEILVCYYHLDYEYIYMYMPKEITEEDFLALILDKISDKKIRDICRLSCCQLTAIQEDLKIYRFLIKRFGRYYFSRQYDTKNESWQTFAEKYLDKRNEKLSIYDAKIEHMIETLSVADTNIPEECKRNSIIKFCISTWKRFSL